MLAVGCSDQPSLTSSVTATIVQPTNTPEPTKASPAPTPTESIPAWLPVPPEKPTIIQLTDNPGWRNENAVWSPDGSKILYISNRECVKPYLDDMDMLPSCWEWDLYLMDADGSNEIRLTDVQFVYQWTIVLPRWSPNGESIAFLYNDFLDLGYKKVVSFSLDRAKKKTLKLEDMEVLVDESEDYLVTRYEWSPDGKMYDYDYYPLGDDFFRRRDISVVNEESREEIYRKTTAGESVCDFETWTLDNYGILIRCLGEETGSQIYWVDVNNGTEKLLIKNAADPVWSPDGKWILYFATETDNYELFHVESGEVVPFPYDNFYIGIIWSWSPDGKWIAFSDFVDDERSKMEILLLDMSWLEMEWD